MLLYVFTVFLLFMFYYLVSLLSLTGFSCEKDSERKRHEYEEKVLHGPQDDSALEGGGNNTQTKTTKTAECQGGSIIIFFELWSFHTLPPAVPTAGLRSTQYSTLCQERIRDPTGTAVEMEEEKEDGMSEG